MSAIKNITVREIRDSRDMPTLRVTVDAEAASGSFEVSSGASTGTFEAHEFRDEDGVGVAGAASIIARELAPALIGMDVTDQRALDERLEEIDGTNTFSRIGGNSAIGISIAAAKAGAASKGCETYEHLRSVASPQPSRRVPRLVVNMFNGGLHAPGGTPIQEHQVIPDTEDVTEALEMVKRIRKALGDVLIGRDKTLAEGDEGGYWCAVGSVVEPFEMLHEAIMRAHLEDRVALGADIAASSMEREGGAYVLLGEPHTPEEMHALYQDLAEWFELSHIEDPFGETEFEAFAQLSRTLPEMVIIGDDLTTTNASRIHDAAKKGSINAVIIKPNQAGTLSRTIDAIIAARENDIHCIASHRSGDTMDDFVADLAFAYGCYGLKAGAPHKPERKVKYERLAKLTYAS